jgi:quercetin dioxygenase-like cupin family protein
MESAAASAVETSRSSAYLHQPGQGEQRWMGDTFTHFLATGDTTNGAFCLVDETARRGEAVPLHRHADDVESFYVVDGEITFFIDGRPGMRGGAGAFAHVPGGVVHGFRVESETARYLILTSPRHGEFYKAITRPAGPNGRPADPSVDGTTIRNAVRDYGIEFIGALPEA